MIRSTRGIVIKSIKYGESSLIVRIFTRELGLQSYIVNGVRKTKGKQKASLFSPLTLLELEVYHKETQSLKRIKECRNFFIYNFIPFDITRSSIGIYVSEILYKSLKSDQPQQQLYDILEGQMKLLDSENVDLTHFPIRFMISLSESLGFGPLKNRKTQEAVFDLVEGRFSSETPEHIHYFEPITAAYFYLALEADSEHMSKNSIPKTFRNTILEGLQNYFRLHIENFGEVNSSKILQEVLSEP